MKRAILFLVFLIILNSSVLAVGEEQKRMTWRWIAGINKDLSEIFKEYRGYDYMSLKNDMTTINFGIFIKDSGIPQSKLTRLRYPSAEAFFLFNIGTTTTYDSDKEIGEEANIAYFHNNFFWGITGSGLFYFWNIFCADLGAKAYKGYINDKDFVYISRASDVIDVPSKISGDWTFGNLFIKVGCHLQKKLKILFGIDYLSYKSDFDYYGYKYFSKINIEREIYNSGNIGEIRLEVGKVLIDFLYRFPNGNKNLSGYQMVFYYIP